MAKAKIYAGPYSRAGKSGGAMKKPKGIPPYLLKAAKGK